MAENKRQHFVPQNYLKDFSSDGVNIGVFLVESGKCVEKPAPINSQAQESYFYGKDLTLEKQLSELEGLLADNRRTIYESHSSKLSLYQKEVLYQDMMLQLSRTKSMANLYEEIATMHARRIWKNNNDELIRKLADDFGVKFDNPIIAAMMVTLKNLTICFDLESKVLVNRTEIPFITSDSPVCAYNQYFEAHNRFYSGLNNIGEQLYYPLSPKYAVLYYDRNVYKTKFKKRSFLDVEDICDVNHLNGLVCAWANKSVYYHPNLISNEHIEWTFDYVRNVRNPRHEETEISTGKEWSIIIARHLFPAFGMTLSFLKYQDKVKRMQEEARSPSFFGGGQKINSESTRV